MSETVTSRIIDFLSRLEGMTTVHLEGDPLRKAAIDLNTGSIIESDPEFPDGEMLLYERPNGSRLLVSTHKLIGHLFAQHAHIAAMSENCSAKQEYEHIFAHFERKTGYGQ